MKIQFWSVGKMHESHVKEGVEMFTKRISFYHPAEWKIVQPPKNAGSLNSEELKLKEADLVLSALKKEDYVVLLDERGKQFTSERLAELLQQRADEGIKCMVFLIGGAYGVHQTLMERANFTWSLSNLVFPHQLVRLMLAEQVYRACTINRNEKYHHA